MTALGNLCSATGQLPTSTVLSVGLEKLGDIAVASGGLNDVWRGKWGGTQVAIGGFRICHDQDLKEAKAVRAQPTQRDLFLTKFTDPVETGSDVEETIPRKYPIVSRREHVLFSARTRSRLGAKRKR